MPTLVGQQLQRNWLDSTGIGRGPSAPRPAPRRLCCSPSSAVFPCVRFAAWEYYSVSLRRKEQHKKSLRGAVAAASSPVQASLSQRNMFMASAETYLRQRRISLWCCVMHVPVCPVTLLCYEVDNSWDVFWRKIVYTEVCPCLLWTQTAQNLSKIVHGNSLRCTWKSGATAEFPWIHNRVC